MAKEDFIPERSETALIVHELQAPLTILRTRLESALRKPWCDADCETLIGECVDEVRRLNQIVVDLLLLDKSEADRLPSNLALFDLTQLVARVGEHFKTVADSKSLRLSVVVRGRLPATADEGQIEQVVANLLDNAIKFTPAGGNIKIEAAPIDSNVMVRVVDTGIGIPQEDYARIFDRFYQIDKAKSRESGGVGLGLAIARSLARHNGGNIQVESTPGRGSCFTLKLASE